MSAASPASQAAEDIIDANRYLVPATADANRYLVLATADATGRPWSSPVARRRSVREGVCPVGVLADLVGDDWPQWCG